jgi:hypothetical protein
MILRCQCRRILHQSSPNVIKRYLPYPAPLILRRNLHLTSPRRAEIDDADPGITEPEEIEEDIPGSFETQDSRPPDRRRSPPSEKKQPQTLLDLRRGLNPSQLGLNLIHRKRKREFVQWLMRDGSEYTHFPQYMAMEIEERRVEKTRKAAEERMFKRMNSFFDSLSMEELQQNELLQEPKTKTHAIDREELPFPSPFWKVIRGQEKIGLTYQEIESRVLSLLGQYNPKLHNMYKNYIVWSDFQLQKRTVWFSFPDTEKYKNVVERLRGLRGRRKPGGKDLANYFGEKLPKSTKFPILPVTLPFIRGRPFRWNDSFHPQRPIPHRLKLRMFDAWREGLGLRNVAWLGGVSWRRVDGIIGILKKEWEYVQQVFLPPKTLHDESTISLEDLYMVSLLISDPLITLCQI